MKLIINMGLSAQVIDLPLSGETIGDLVAAGEIPDIGPIWDILKGDAGDAPVPPTTITAPSASASSVSEGTEITFVAGVYTGDEPMSVSRVLRVDGSVVDAEFSELSYTPPITGANRVVSVTETAANAAGTRTETVTVTVQRIPVAPSVDTHVSLSPASPAQGETISITPPTWTGDTPLTITFTATLDGNDVAGSVSVTGSLYEYTPAVTGEFIITFSATNAAGGPAVSSASVAVSAFVLNNTGLNPATANIMIEGESQACSWLYDTWAVDEDPARPSHEWSQVFRSAYSGSHFGPVTGGAGSLPGGLPGIGNGCILGPGNGTESNWLTGSFPAGNSPRSDLASFQALVIWERAGGGHSGTLADPFGWQDLGHLQGAASDFRGEWYFAERAAQNGIKSIFLAGPRQAMIDDGATPVSGVRSEWRDIQLLSDARVRARQQYLQHKLRGAGYTDVSVFVIPFHLLELKLHDDVMNDDPAKPATITSYYDYHSEDAGWTNNNGHHAYMHSRLGSYADWCLAYSVLFATTPVGISNAATGHSIASDEAAYLQQLAWDLAQDYYPTGLGGTTGEEVVWEPYANELLPALLPAASTSFEVPTADKFTDLAGTVSAGDGDPVGNVAGYQAAATGARPLLSDDHLVMTDDPISATMSPFSPNYGMLLVALNDAMTDPETIFRAADGGTVFDLQVDADNEFLGSIVAITNDGNYTYTGIPLAYFDGRLLMIEWELKPSGQNTLLKVTDVSEEVTNTKFYRQLHDGNALSGTKSTYTIGGPANGAESTEMSLYACVVSSAAPANKDRLKVYARLESVLGGPLWFPEAYG
ncbi:hypothetical protein [Paracoccus sp. (in: a-proteobacteria)]|uniref:hypothetical protein n=1 Tax=Paracoccus sp. TaxID=267 RepID=UPI00405A2348